MEILYGLVPPKAENSKEKNDAVTHRRIQRLQKVPIDGLVIYDIQDESARTDSQRTFPFKSTLDPVDYALQDLKPLEMRRIVYLVAGKYTPVDLQNKLTRLKGESVVLVGAASSREESKISLGEAYNIVGQQTPKPDLGAIFIPERHGTKGDEHLRMIKKAKRGAGFFISQCVYDAALFKKTLMAYKEECLWEKVDIKPVYITLTPCGSAKTLEFLGWMGVDVPQSIQKALKEAEDPISKSLEICESIFEEVLEFCTTEKIPLGINVESVAVSKAEVLASLDLVRRLRDRK